MTTDHRKLRDLAEDTLAQTGPNVIGSAAWFRRRATELAEGLTVVLEEAEKLRRPCVQCASSDRSLDASATCSTCVANLREQLAVVRKQADDMLAVNDEQEERLASATAAAERRLQDMALLVEQLVAMTAARDELAEIAEGAIGDDTSLECVREGLERVTELRKVGA